MKINQTMTEFMADQILIAPERVFNILRVLDDSPTAASLTALTKQHQQHRLSRQQLMHEINRRCDPIPELARCPHTPDLFELNWTHWP